MGVIPFLVELLQKGSCGVYESIYQPDTPKHKGNLYS
jgi:hypothetical protein